MSQDTDNELAFTITDNHDGNTEKQPRLTNIKIIGIGTGGISTILRVATTLPKDVLKYVQLISATTSIQELNRKREVAKAQNCEDKIQFIQIGKNTTGGAGAGTQSAIGCESAQESRDEIKQALNGADLVFIVTGLGGGTGSGATPIVVEIVKELNDERNDERRPVLSMSIATLPFSWEGYDRIETAEESLKEINKYANSSIIIPNDKLEEIFIAEDDDDGVTIEEGFAKSDEILTDCVTGMINLIYKTSDYLNIDYADIKNMLQFRGCSVMYIGSATNTDLNKCIDELLKTTLNNPLLSHLSFKQARGVLCNITMSAGRTNSMKIVKQINIALNKMTEGKARFKAGVTANENLSSDTLQLQIFATGIPEPESMKGYGTNNNSTFDDDSSILDDEEFFVSPMKPKSNETNHITTKTEQTAPSLNKQQLDYSYLAEEKKLSSNPLIRVGNTTRVASTITKDFEQDPSKLQQFEDQTALARKKSEKPE